MKTWIFALVLACVASHASAIGNTPVAAQALQEFSGNYDLADGHLLTVSQRHRQLYAQIDGGPAIEIVAAGQASFAAKSGELRLEFDQAPNGSVAGVRLVSSSPLRR